MLRRSQPLLGTFVTITAYGGNREELARAVSAAFAEFRRVDQVMSVHKTNSELSRLNARAALEPVPVSPELFFVLSQALQIGEQTEGGFDAAIGPLTQLWGFIWKEYRLPTEAELQATLPLTDYRLVQVDPSQKTVRFDRPGVMLDLNGIAKGYAVDCAIQALQARGVQAAMVKAGGDLRVIGLPPGESFWAVQLEDPAKEGRRVQVRLKEGALSTSGDYENNFVIAGRRYAHILNPRTGLPVQGVAACTVVAPTCLESDAWATACFVYGPERSLNQFGSRYGLRFTRSPTGGGGKGDVLQSPGFPPLSRW